uniref:Uncharacterized protein n=1 Tax=Cyanothece sp. (strain PCC 7425 / ATCC 29141) TaxID=395961 RepID=B8HMF2_CYAP4
MPISSSIYESSDPWLVQQNIQHQSLLILNQKIVRVQDVDLSGADDPNILQWTA